VVTERFHTVVTRAGQWLLKTRDSLLERQDSSWLPSPAGQRVVLVFDGGRFRLREDKQGRKRANGYRDVTARWVEPRQFVISTLDEQGKYNRGKQIRVADAMLAEGAQVIALLKSYLSAMKIWQATQVVVGADGQSWQWDQLNAMLDELGVAQENRLQVLALCHAVGRLAEVADALGLVKGTGARSSFMRQGKKLLQDDDRKGFQAHCAQWCKGRSKTRVDKADKLLKYFENHEERMKCPLYRQKKVPCGSGMVESMRRQVVNLRLKGCGKFWKKEGAQAMLLMRSMLKTQRLETLMSCAMRHQADCLPTPQQATDSQYLDQDAA
jgi:hypothetical protein